jgi:hypothetical protein
MKFLFALFFTFPALAQVTEHTLIRRLSVFPIKTSDELKAKADEIWWDLRETMTKDKRFLVATKNFLQQQNVYQARAELDPASAIILGRLLDADAVMVEYLDKRMLHMAVYEANYGRPLWTQEVALQPSLPVGEQLEPAVLKLARDFIASIPYQGFVVVDPLKAGPLYREGKRLLVKADIGLGAEAEVGDPFDLVKITSDHIKPLFTHGANIEVFAEGRIVSIDRETVTAELTRLARTTDVHEKTLVRLPKEMKRLEQLFALSDSLKGKINPEFLSPEMTSAKQEVAENKPLIASVVFIVNLAAFFLLAF